MVVAVAELRELRKGLLATSIGVKQEESGDSDGKKDFHGNFFLKTNSKTKSKTNSKTKSKTNSKTNVLVINSFSKNE